MGSKREEERNEKIIRGLMKLPPNRRCINCNSLGPQYVCTNFWTFVCMTCSGIHREFTHRVKSVSMSKFTSQEVDALQNGGNQRARELYLKAWNPERQRLPDNSNVDKVREFIKNVYVDKKYAVEKSSDRPPKDPQSVRNQEDEMRRASSYHSYSQSPPYDFQYEERRYGKHLPALTRKPGSDRGLYAGKLASFVSPSRSSDHANDNRFANEGSLPRASEYPVSSGGDPFRSNMLSPSSQRDTWSPFSETSRDFSSEIQGNHTIPHNANSDGGRIVRPQRTASSGNPALFDNKSLSFKSVSSMDLHEVASAPELSVEISLHKSSSLPYQPQSSVSNTFNGLDLFSAPFAPENVTSTTVGNSQLPVSSSPQSVDLFQQAPISSIPAYIQQQPSQSLQPSPFDLFTVVSPQQSVVSPNGKTSDVETPNSGGWATFDVPQKSVPMVSETSALVATSSSDGNFVGSLTAFSLNQTSSNQNAINHEQSASTNTFWMDGLQNVETTTTSNGQSWNAFEDSAGQQPIQDVPQSTKQAPVHSASDVNKSLTIGAYEAFVSDENVGTPNESEPNPPSLSSHFSMPLNDISMIPAVAGIQSVATEHKAINPFDLPYDSDMESSNVAQFWDMGSLQAALPTNQPPAPYVGAANQSWFTQNPVPSYASGGVAFDPPNGSLGFIAGQLPSTQIPNVPAQGPFASVGGNPFA